MAVGGPPLFRCPLAWLLEYLYSFDRMGFQQMDKQDNAGRFERGYLKATTENLTNWTLLEHEKPPKTNF